MPRARLATALAATLLALALAAPGAARAVEDADGDGVADATDACPDTAAGELVAPDGCTVCPCEATVGGAPWGTHQAYVQCVVAAARAARGAHRGSRRSLRQAIRRAKRSTCGNDDQTRCCVFPDDPDLDADEVTGRCRVTTVDACDSLADEVDAEDWGPGSCTPNPCVY
jgi:hypothetical protein